MVTWIINDCDNNESGSNDTSSKNLGTNSHFTPYGRVI